MKQLLLTLLLFSAANLKAQDPTVIQWKGKWIEPGYTEDPMRPSPVFQKIFTVKKKIKSAVIYITAHGLYEGTINNTRIGDAYLTPGWTSYDKRLQYQQYNAAPLLHKGENALQITLGSGWYRGILGLDNKPDKYGDKAGLLLQLEIQYADKTHETVVSDASWKSATASIRYAEIYNGEIIDARKKAEEWTGVREADYPMNNLVPTINEPIKKHEVFAPVKIFIAPNGDTLADFGQNFAGWIKIKVSGKTGDSIIIDHGEILDHTGNFYNANLRTAKARDTYILSGKTEETFEPHFTFHGFRYARIKGLRAMPTSEQLQGIALYSSTPASGTFECSNPLINQLQHNILWSQNSNFLDVPTDCPQRDERLGWMGDAMVFCRTAAFNRNVHLFFKKWLMDVAADQFASGSVPQVVPNILGEWGGSSGWAEAATVIPSVMYEIYADTQLLRNQYSSMKAWVDYMQHNSRNDLFAYGFQFGDWLSYRSEGLMERSAWTDVSLINQCFYAYSTQLLINAAVVLGNKEDEKYYTALISKIKEAFNKEYVTPNGRLMSNTQTAYVLALQFDMLPDSMREGAAKKLVDNIASYKYHLTTGFLGTPYLCHVLSRFGYTDVAYKLLLQETYPSWLYPVKMGATTIWERWDGVKTNGSFQTTDMNSFNHYSYGAIGDWLYRVVAGIQPDPAHPGYKHFIIRPHPGGDLTWVKADYVCPYGNIHVQWKIENGKCMLDVKVPSGTTADIYAPDATGEHFTLKKVGAGEYHTSTHQ